MFGLIPREEAFFDLFKNAAHNMIEGSRLLKDMTRRSVSKTLNMSATASRTK